MHRTPWLLAFAVASLASLGIWGVTVLGDRRTVLEAAQAKLAATATLLEQHADRALEAGDRVVQAAVLAAGDPATLHEPGRPEALHRRLRELVEGNPQTQTAWVLDAEGRTVAENWRFPPLNQGRYLHRAYAKAHLEGERGLHIGPMAIGTNLGLPRFTLSRRLETPDGAFAGVAATGVVSGYFARTYAEAGLGEGARFTLFRADGAPLAVWPLPAGNAGAAPLDAPDRPPAPGRSELRQSDEALTAVRALADYPVVLVAQVPLSAVLADWKMRMRQSGAVVAAVIAALGILTVLGLRGARQQRALLGTLTAERADLERRVAERTAALAESEARFREMADFAPMMVWVTGSDGGCTFLSRSWHEFTGQAPSEGLGFAWLDMVHPEDRPQAEACFREATARAAPFRLEYRLRRAGGGWAWAMDAAAPRFAADGAFLGYIGSVIDITERHEAEERRALMARELDHRAKNALTVVQAALRLTPREDPTAFATAVEGRVATLARAHTVLAEGRWQGASLRTVAEAELAAFLGPASRTAPSAMIAGPEVLLAPTAVQAMSMALHELATNATKYGALSVPGGRLSVAWSIDAAAGALRLAWEERGGPRLAGPPVRRGFGTRVVAATMEGQLGGTITREWRPEGLACVLELPLGRVLAAAPDPEPTLLAVAAQ